MKFSLPTTISDPSESALLGDSWIGTSGNDRLIWRKGNDTIDGLRGYDTLVILAPRAEASWGKRKFGAFQLLVDNPDYNPEVSISSSNPRRFNLAAVGIERLQLLDEVIEFKPSVSKRGGKANRRRGEVSADPSADAALARTPLSMSVSLGEEDPASIERNTPFCSVAADLF